MQIRQILEWVGGETATKVRVKTASGCRINAFEDGKRFWGTADCKKSKDETLVAANLSRTMFQYRKKSKEGIRKAESTKKEFGGRGTRGGVGNFKRGEKKGCKCFKGHGKGKTWIMGVNHVGARLPSWVREYVDKLTGGSTFSKTAQKNSRH